MIKVGSNVGWLWGSSIAVGQVIEIHPSRYEIVSKNKKIVRNGSDNDPALVISHKSGNNVLKLMHEVQEIDKKEA